jgi:hypothetical protein
VYAILAVVLWIAILLGKGRYGGAPPMSHHGMPHTSPRPPGYFAVWEWRDDQWRQVAGNLPDGVEAGPPPHYPGAFDGETIKTWVAGKPRP